MSKRREISNRNFRRWMLSLQGLAPSRTEDRLPVPLASKISGDIETTVERLGFVQIDPIKVVSRAHDQILFTRIPTFHHQQLRRAIDHKRTLFENWTHDAAILPSGWFPYWRHYMARFKRWEMHTGYRRYFEPVTPGSLRSVRRHLRENGECRPRDLPSEKVDWGDSGWPEPSLARVSMEYLWRTGELAISRREGQEKIYDLAERVIPSDALERRVRKREQIDWACRESLRRLGAGTPSQIAHYFDAVSTDDAKGWCQRRLGDEVEEVEIEGAALGQSRRGYSLSEAVPEGELPSTNRLRLLSPFDPLIHDRKRAKFIFGFDYRVEIFVPATKRQFGYYVMPILDGDRFVGRVDMKCDRKRRRLEILSLWWEPGLRPSATRQQRFERQLERQARFSEMDGIGKVPRAN
jgi:uncharacterized protein YcaQ